MCHRFSDDYCFNAFIYCANFHSSFINFISYYLLFWHNKFSMLLCEKNIKVTWFQQQVALPFVIKFLKLLFQKDFVSDFNLLNFVLLFRFWFSDSRTSEENSFFEFCFCCCYSVSIVFNLLFLLFIYRI